MARFTHKEILNGLRSGSKEVLSHLTKRYYQSSRRWLRTKGIRDADTPAFFAGALLRFLREAQQRNLPEQTVPSEQLFVHLKNQLKEHRMVQPTVAGMSPQEEQQEIVAHCFSILDESARELLMAHYADRLNFEQLASRFQLSNPVIAEFEVDKAMKQLEHIVRARLLT